MALLVGACARHEPEAARQPGPAFDPIAFFTGKSHGDATLKQIFKPDRPMSVDSVGRMGADGTLILTQRIAVEGDKPRIRQWAMRRAGSNAYAGRLTDAVGPVDTRVVGRALRIRYRMKGGLEVEQWLVALPGGRVLDNRLAVSKWGIEIASVHERIAKR